MASIWLKHQKTSGHATEKVIFNRIGRTEDTVVVPAPTRSQIELQKQNEEQSQDQ